MNETLNKFFHFLDASPTSWHAAKEIGRQLTECGFAPLSETESWQLEKGTGYFVVRDGSAVAAFRLPKKKAKRALLLASHLDSPALKLKPIADVGGEVSQFFTEIYGSPLLHTWLDRDLALAGRALVKTKEKPLESLLVYLKEHPLIIPSLAPHLDRSIGEKGLQINKQDHLRPIASLAKNPLMLEEMLRRHISFEELLAHDLFLVPLEKAAFLGPEKEMIASYRLDNLTSAFAMLFALTNSKPLDDALQICVFFDHEEVGSESFLGAASSFLNQLLDRIALHEGISGDELFCFKNRTWCISADAAHGYHPNFSDRFDPKNAPCLGKGVVLKTNAQQRYATSATSAAPLIQICKDRKLPLQTFASKSDIPSGSTVGAIVSAVCGIPTVDIGIASLAMHSIRETISSEDLIGLLTLLKEVIHYAPKS